MQKFNEGTKKKTEDAAARWMGESDDKTGAIQVSE